MAAAVDEFSVWLGNKLQALDTDEGVFGSYITGILDGDEPLEEKVDALEGILSEIVASDITSLCKEIIEKWQKSRQAEKQKTEMSLEDVDDKLVRLLESQTLTTTVQREYTAEERKIKDAILAQYSQMTDDEEEGVEECAGDTRETRETREPRENGLERNTNAFSVQQAEKEKREMAKVESQKKKDKDREDREKQKQMKEDKKEKRKTQKGERRR